MCTVVILIVILTVRPSPLVRQGHTLWPWGFPKLNVDLYEQNTEKKIKRPPISDNCHKHQPLKIDSCFTIHVLCPLRLKPHCRALCSRLDAILSLLAPLRRGTQNAISSMSHFGEIAIDRLQTAASNNLGMHDGYLPSTTVVDDAPILTIVP